MTIWLTSDWHLQHQLVSKLRGFSSPEEHDEVLIKNFQQLVQSDDVVFCLGDVAFNANMKGWQENLKLVQQIPGHKHLIVGNHDRCAPNNSNGWKFKAEFQTVFETVSEFTKLSFEGIGVLLSHYPYDTTDSNFGEKTQDSRADKFAKYRLRDEEMPLIHGHTHTHSFLTYSEKRTPQVNVNLESTEMKPMKLEDIIELIKKT